MQGQRHVAVPTRADLRREPDALLRGLGRCRGSPPAACTPNPTGRRTWSRAAPASRRSRPLRSGSESPAGGAKEPAASRARPLPILPARQGAGKRGRAPSRTGRTPASGTARRGCRRPGRSRSAAGCSRPGRGARRRRACRSRSRRRRPGRRRSDRLRREDEPTRPAPRSRRAPRPLRPLHSPRPGHRARPPRPTGSWSEPGFGAGRAAGPGGR